MSNCVYNFANYDSTTNSGTTDTSKLERILNDITDRGITNTELSIIDTLMIMQSFINMYSEEREHKVDYLSSVESLLCYNAHTCFNN